VQTETISADDGKQLHIRPSGSGTPIPLLHGWTSSHAAWAPLIKPLAGQHRLLRPDARGHGGHALSATRAPDVRRLARNNGGQFGAPARPRVTCRRNQLIFVKYRSTLNYMM